MSRSARYRLLLATTLTAVCVTWAGLPAVADPTTAARAPGHGPAGICSVTPRGNLVHCPRPIAPALQPAASKDTATVQGRLRNPAAHIDTRTWTSGGGNTFPGADVPFGMVQWSPDTLPDRSDGGGYTYSNDLLDGYSLTHLSGPGCEAAGDVPILPMTGKLPNGNPTDVRTPFSHHGEIVQAGYYAAYSNAPSTIYSQFTATPHSALGQFDFPRTTRADFLIKLAGSERGDHATSAKIVSSTQVQGSVSSGGFCGETQSRFGPQHYTIYFDIMFSQPFTADRVITEPGRKTPNSMFLIFNTTSDPVIDAKVAISYVSPLGARANIQAEQPGWNFTGIRSAAQAQWNKLLGEVQVWGGSVAQTQEFYSLLYKTLLQPNIVSDVNGEYLGSDFKLHDLSSGQANQYGMFSGWDMYHSQAQLVAMLDPTAASDMAQSLVNYYAQNGILPQWGYLNLDNYAQLGDPADAIIADIYAFGGTGFDTQTALADMLDQADHVDRVRPGTSIEAHYGYLPAFLHYDCCRLNYQVSALLEYDSADFALSQFAAALGDATDAATLQARANNWTNVLDTKTGLLTPRTEAGGFVAGVTPDTSKFYLEGDAEEYLWDVPNNYAGLFAKLGGVGAVRHALVRYLSKPNGRGSYAYLSNEFDLGEQYALDYDRDPAGTQRADAILRDDLFLPGPFGLPNNDDLGAESSQFIWAMLGMYPENPGSGTLVFASPGFPNEVINLPSGATITITAPGASANRYYVKSLTINGTADNALSVPFSTLAQGATLNWVLGSTPTSWGNAPSDAPPSYPDPPA